MRVIISISGIVIVMLINAVIAKPKATELDVLVGLDRPPYVMEKQTSGYELELLDEVFAQMGFQLNYLFMASGRSAQFIEARSFEVVATINEDFGTDQQHHTNPYVFYDNHVVSLAKNDLTIKNVTDLEKLQVAAFQPAQKILGEAYRQATNKAQLYLEIANQLTRVEMLYKGRLDAIIIDKNVFNYLSQKHSFSGKVRFHNIFEKTGFSLWLKNKELIPLFNETLNTYRRTEAYTLLQNKYGVANQYQQIN